MEKKYLSYGIDGIQGFIFKIPKLRYIIGGSALIDRFDKKVITQLSNSHVEIVFSGGGGGVLYGETQHLEQLKLNIKDAAHRDGLDIYFGLDSEFVKAFHQVDEFYPFIPKINEGAPCIVSGLYPAQDNAEHDVIKKRLYQKGEKIFRHFEDRFLKDISIDDVYEEKVLSFFHNVDANDDEDGKLGAKALGNRNRWAVIAMDGNDVGMQFRHIINAGNTASLSEDIIKQQIKDMSKALDDCSTKAASAGIQAVVFQWQGTKEGKNMIDKKNDITLPVRPLLVGGDDIIVLCHCSYAMTFVKHTMQAFTDQSQKKPNLWPATNGKLTISAGVLYANVSLPLHTAINYSEALLVSAKTHGRTLIDDGEASQACIDWEQITDSIVDTPEAKRQRELIFIDDDLKRNIKLTQRPYSIDDYEKVEDIAIKYSHSNKGVATTTRHKILPALSKNFTERLAFYAEVKKNHEKTIFNDLNEFDDANFGKLWTINHEKNEQSTSIIDALSLLEEESRMSKETI